MNARGAALIAVAIALSVALLGVQIASGGADFVPQRAADPCQDRQRTGKKDLEGLVETVVLTGLDDAACKLGVTRERLLLALPYEAERAELAREAGTDERGLAQAIQDGMRTGVDRLETSGQLPRTSELLPSIADQLGVSRTLVDLIPDNVVDRLLPTAAVLRAAIDVLDVDTILEGLDENRSFESTLREALIKGAIDEVRERIEDALQGALG
jgi:hypothetical protein